MTECNSALGEIVGGKFQCDLVTRQNANAIAAEPPGQMCQDDALVFELYTELAGGKLL